MERIIVGFLIWTLLAIAASEPEDPTKGKVMVLKCCSRREELVKRDNETIPRCVPTTNIWTPIIYSQDKRSLLAQIPVEWQILEGQKPECAESHVLTYLPFNALSPFILMDTGKAVLEIGSGKEFNEEEYCADANGLFMCVSKNIDSERAASTMKPIVRRCCGLNAAYDENRYR